MKLFGTDIGKYAIVIEKNAGTSVRVAAGELQAYILKIFGVDLPILEGAKSGKAIALRVGACKASRPDGFCFYEENGNFVIASQTEEGVLFGAYYFLEKYLGVEWLTPDCEVLPNFSAQVDIRPQEIYDFSAWIRICHSNFAYNEKYRARHRLRFSVGDINDKEAYGGLRGVKFAFSWGLFGHTFSVLLPYEKYYAEHPEYYSFAEGHYGENNRYQICLTNPDVLKIVTENALAYLEEHKDCKLISISQNDSFGDFENNYCTCPSCKAIFEKDGNYSAVLLQFVNKVARVIGEKYPNVLVHTFAYMFSENPPVTVKPEKNVVVQLCLMGLPYSYALTDDTEKSERQLKKFEKWHTLTDKLFIWTYVCKHTDYLAPIGNFRALYENTSYLLRKNLFGVFQQERMDYYCGEFSELRSYLTAKLFSNPYISYEEYKELIVTFCNGVYGKGGVFIAKYIELLDMKFHGVDINEKTEEELLRFYGEKTFIKAGTELYEAAEKAETGECLTRIRANRLQFDFCRLCYLYLKQDEHYVSERKRFVENMHSFGIRHYKEGKVIPPIEKLDCTKSPFFFAPMDKTIVLKDGKESACQKAGDSTSSENYGFDFTFMLKRKGKVLTVSVEVADDEIYCTDNNIRNWEQDCIEIYVSESCNRGKKRLEGDYSVRVNANGMYGVSFAENKIRNCRAEKTAIGYKVTLDLFVDSEKIGFEIMAHDFSSAGKYRSTRYWNALKNSDVFDCPYYYGIVELDKQ